MKISFAMEEQVTKYTSKYACLTWKLRITTIFSKSSTQSLLCAMKRRCSSKMYHITQKGCILWILFLQRVKISRLILNCAFNLTIHSWAGKTNFLSIKTISWILKYIRNQSKICMGKCLPLSRKLTIVLLIITLRQKTINHRLSTISKSFTVF